jgi:DNA-binding MarR family transcriptional regulator/GNAT superfamily N-acetyltransferase
MDSGMVDRVRRFNRTVTERVGALDDRFLARDRPLGPARLLWEIGPDGQDVRALRARLGLDSGYVSRLLRGLESEGLITVGRGETDARVRTARLTDAGRAERTVLDRRSTELASRILTPLDDRQRGRLVAAMDEVERLLTASAITIAACDPRHRYARQCVRAYFDELAARFEDGFDPARSIPADDDDLTPPTGLLLVATLRSEPVGCGALKLHNGDAAEVKRMWVSPSVRGLGLGRRLLAELEAAAGARGAPALRLETNRSLTEAIGLYRAAGFVEVEPFNAEPYAHHWFHKPIVP